MLLLLRPRAFKLAAAVVATPALPAGGCPKGSVMRGRAARGIAASAAACTSAPDSSVVATWYSPPAMALRCMKMHWQFETDRSRHWRKPMLRLVQTIVVCATADDSSAVATWYAPPAMALRSMKMHQKKGQDAAPNLCTMQKTANSTVC
jgi:hypothetical protein